VLSNPAEVPKDGIAMWEKRMETNDKSQSVDAEGVKEKETSESTSPPNSPPPPKEEPVGSDGGAKSNFAKFLELLENDPAFIRPRKFGSGAVGTPKRELVHGTVDTKSYVSDSSLLRPTQVTPSVQRLGLVRPPPIAYMISLSESTPVHEFLTGLNRQ
jgi:hypothetical protein